MIMLNHISSKPKTAKKARLTAAPATAR